MNSDAHLRVLAICGSLRKASCNGGLLRAAQEAAPEGMEITIFNIKDLPFYDGDIEAQGHTASVVAGKSDHRHDGSVMCGPPELSGGRRGG